MTLSYFERIYIPARSTPVKEDQLSQRPPEFVRHTLLGYTGFQSVVFFCCQHS